VAKKDPMIGRVLRGSIEITRLIGRGGMGNVYEAMQTQLERKVAVKVMTPEHAANPMAADYFIREAKLASQIRHPNIIQIIDFGKEGDDVLFIAMEFVPGVPLTNLMKDEFPLDPKRVVDIMSQAMDGLAEAHSHELVHRDLKPDNLMVEKTRDDRDFVKILDFGISQSKSKNTEMGPLTQANALVGTPQYMSPEQARGDSVDHRSDLFSMGTILYEMLTGVKPFSGSHVPQILMEVIQKNPILPSQACPDHAIHPELEAICLRAMKKERELRYQTATEFRDALQRVGAVEKKPAAAAAFIFKRTKRSEDGSRPNVKAPFSSPDSLVVDEDSLHTISLRKGKDAPVAVDTPALGEEPDRVRANEPEFGFAGTDIQHAGMGGSDSEVVDTSKLFGDVAPASPPKKSIYGFDDQIQDLVGEKRNATILVSHQRTHGSLTSEELSTHLHVYDSALEQVAKRWNGVVQSRQGSYATLAFGVVKTSPDDGFRATQAALDLRSHLRRMMPAEFAFGFGLSQGELFMQGGDISRASGQVIDHAIDGSREAGDGEVLVVGPALEELIAATFKFGPALKSGNRPVLGILDVAHQPTTKASNLVGRDDEIAAALSALGRISRGQGAFFAVTGHAGMGKTALLQEVEAFAEQRGYLILRARARATGVEGVRDAITQWLKDLARIHGRNQDLDVLFRELGLAAEPSRLLSGFVQSSVTQVIGARGTGRSMDSGTSTMAAVDVAFRALLSKIQESRAIVLTFDQLDSYDEAMSGWFERWFRHLADSRVLWLLGIRVRSGHPLHPLPADASSVYIDALDEAATRLLFKAELAQDVSTAFRAELANLSGGVPLQIRQIIDHVKRHKLVSREGAEKWLAEARDINSVLQMRLFDLKTNERNLLALLAVLGNGTRGEVLLDLASDDWQPESAIQNLFVEGVLEIQGAEDDPILSFKPQIFERVVHDRLSVSARRQIHGRAIDYFFGRLKNVRDPEKKRAFELALVRHLVECERHPEAVQVLDRVADECMIGFDYELAEVYLSQAVSILTKAGAPAEAVAQRNLRRVRVQGALGNLRVARDLCLAMGRMSDLPDALSLEIKIEQGFLWLKEEDPDRLVDTARRTLAAIRAFAETQRTPFTIALLVRGLQLMAEINSRQSKDSQAIQALLEAVALIERNSLDSTNPWGPKLLWEPVNQLARLRLKSRELPGAASLLEVALRVANESQDVRGEMTVRGNYGTLFAEQGNLEAAIRSVQTAIKLAVSVNDLNAHSKLLHNLGLMHLRQRRRDLAEECFQTSLDLADQLDWREGIAMNASQLNVLRHEQDSGFMKPRGS